MEGHSNVKVKIYSCIGRVQDTKGGEGGGGGNKKGKEGVRKTYTLKRWVYQGISQN